MPTECIYGEDAAAAVELEVDSLFGSSSSSDEDEPSDNEEDDEERADDATALGFMKSLGVDVYTLEEGVDELARSTFEAGASGIAGLAALAAPGVLPASSPCPFKRSMPWGTSNRRISRMATKNTSFRSGSVFPEMPAITCFCTQPSSAPRAARRA